MSPSRTRFRRVGKKEVRLKIYGQTLLLIPGSGLIRAELVGPKPRGGGRGAPGPCLPLIFSSPGPGAESKGPGPASVSAAVGPSFLAGVGGAGGGPGR